MVEEKVRSISQELASIGAPDTQLTSQGEIDIRLRFQYWCYDKKENLPNQVYLIPLQAIYHISIIAMVSGKPILMVESNMIIIAYFFLIRPSEYMAYKSEITQFRLE